MAILIVLGHPAVGARYHVPGQGTTVLGRDPACDVVLRKGAISRFHAKVVSSHGRFFIEDNRSTNGTFVNGQRIDRKTPLHDGDHVNLHDIPIRFFLDDRMPADVEPTERVNGKGSRVDLTTDPEMPRYTGEPGPSALRERLGSLIEIARHLGQSLDTEEIFPRVLDLLFHMFPQTTVGEIYVKSPAGRLVPIAMKHGRESDSTDLTGAPFNAELIQNVFDSGKGVVRTMGAGDATSVLDDSCQSVVCVPLCGPEESVLGVILLEADDPAHVFQEDDFELASAVAVLAGQALGYAQAHDIVLRHAHTERQLTTARQIQLGMLPRARPRVSGYRFADYYATADRVGGDYYFYDNLRDNRIILGIADASGKGLSAAMNIVRFAGEVRLRIATSPTLKAAMSTLNHFVRESAEEGMFITCCICVLDPLRHTLTVANAGHPPPLIKRAADGSVDELIVTRGSLPLGIDPSEEVHPAVFPLAPGDQVLLYTDGVSEAMNPEHRLFGIPQLKLALETGTGDIQSMISTVTDRVDRFRNGRSHSDDTTLLGFERLPPSSRPARKAS